MPVDPALPNDDRDLRLARRLDPEAQPPASSDDPLVDDPLVDDPLADDPLADDPLADDLRAYRAAHTEAPSAETTERLWAALAPQLERKAPPVPHRRPFQGTPADRAAAPAPVYRMRPLWRVMSAAAVVLVALGLGWLAFLRPIALPVLVADADAEATTYTAPDGSIVTLRPHSTLYTLTEAPSDALRFRLDGEAFFEVVPNAGRTFSVEANNGVVTVLGTRFNVSTWGDAVAVYLEEGRVRFAALGREADAVVLAPGQASTLAAGTVRPQAPARARAADHLDWMAGALAFESRPFHAVLDELAHHYGLHLTTADDLADETLSGRVLLQAVDQSLHDLAFIMGGRFLPTGPPGTYHFVRDDP